MSSFFSFKSKKHQDRALNSRDGNSGSQGSASSMASRLPRDEKIAAQQRSTPTGSLNSLDNDVMPGSPERGHGRRGGSLDQTLPGENGTRIPQQLGNMNASLYPWSQKRLTQTTSHPSPFPRYGAAVNSLSSKEGDIYLMGGLINSSTVKGDLWMIEAGGNNACYPLATTAEGPGPRVGHSSLLVGNAFIVYGGDTKIDESDVLDETLYLLNTSTRQWSRALPAGPRPSGRYGHSLNILGSKIFIFGGQVEGDFMNDLSAFDLNQLQMPNNRWEMLAAADPSPKVPAARTNHSMVTYGDKMYLFGGTNGFQWFNDVWCYDAPTNKWTQLDCIGYIPAPREGHAAALVDDVMYVFGGRTEEGTDLGDLAAFRITSRRWYTFQNMGPSPSPRSGHSMTTVGKSIVTLGGEPSSPTAPVHDLGVMYILDTTKIRYPTDAQGAQRLPQGQSRRPSLEQTARRDGSIGPSDQRKVSSDLGAPGQVNGHRSPPPNGMESPSFGGPGSKLPRAAPQSGTNSPQPGPTIRSVAEVAGPGRVRAASADRTGATVSPQIGSFPRQTTIAREVIAEAEVPVANGRRTPQQQPQSLPTQPQSQPPSQPQPPPPTQQPQLSQAQTQAQSQQAPTKAASKQDAANWDVPRSNSLKQGRSKGSVDSMMESGSRALSQRPASPPPPTRQPSNPLSRRSSGRNSQTVALLKELDSARNRNAWYASELELARKAGYSSNANFNPALEGKATESFDDEDRPLIEALIAMRTELATIQNTVDQQAALSARHVAEAERQRDAAIQEAVYANAKLAAQLGGAGAKNAYNDLASSESGARSDTMGKKLAAALHLQRELQSRLDSAKAELDSERKARQLADDTTGAAQRRMAELESYKQQTSTEVERLKAELHLAQKEARERSVSSSDAVAAYELLKVEKAELESKYKEAAGSSKGQNNTFESLKAAIAASVDANNHLQAKLEEERAQKEKVETKLNKLKGEHEARTAELVAATQRLRDAEELGEKHANEARTHRQAVLAGLDKLTLKDESKATNGDAERVIALQKQVAASNSLVKKYQQEADVAADRLRAAEERIAGLEQYQEQSSREGVQSRKLLQSAQRDAQSLQALNTELRNQLAAQQLETNAMTVQLAALKDILNERGISPTGAVRARGLTSPRTNSPEQGRVRELEAMLASANAAHEGTKQSFAAQVQETEVLYREKLSQLEGDYQSAVHYVKGTEKMLKQLKDQLSRYKTENGQLKSDLVELEDKLQANGGEAAASAGWEAERNSLHKKIESLEADLKNAGAKLQRDLEALRADLNESQRQRDEAKRSTEETVKQFATQQKSLEQLRADNALLEQRATDAEQKVSLLLDQVEHSVDSYRRQSRQLTGANPEQVEGANGMNLGHTRQESSEVGSEYGGNNRNSTALDNLASELETLRSHWEATNKNYRLSNNFDLDTNITGKRDDDGSAGHGLSESLADWRKRLDTEEHVNNGAKPRV